MVPEWTAPSGDPFLLPDTSQNSFPLDMDNLFAFDDSLFSNCNDESLDSSNLTNTVDFDSQYYNSTTDNSPNISNDPGLTMSQVSKTTSYDSTSPESLISGMGFDSLNPSLLSPQEGAALDEWLLNPTTGQVTRSTEHDSSKRTRGVVDDDVTSCWKSPICPNKTADGSRPDSCHGECADFLFANPSQLPDDKKILADIMAKSEPRIALEPPRSSQGRLKRSSKTELEGRELFSTKSPSPSISSQVSPPASKSDRPIKSTSTKKSIPALPSPPASTPKPKHRVPHNQVEKKYRENVNSQLDALRRAIPGSKMGGFDSNGADIEDIGGGASRQPSKAAVLSNATSYIRQLEKDNKRMMEEMEALRKQNVTLQSLVRCEDCALMKFTRNWRIGAQG